MTSEALDVNSDNPLSSKGDESIKLLLRLSERIAESFTNYEVTEEDFRIVLSDILVDFAVQNAGNSFIDYADVTNICKELHSILYRVANEGEAFFELISQDKEGEIRSLVDFVDFYTLNEYTQVYYQEGNEQDVYRSSIAQLSDDVGTALSGDGALAEELSSFLVVFSRAAVGFRSFGGHSKSFIDYDDLDPLIFDNPKVTSQITVISSGSSGHDLETGSTIGLDPVEPFSRYLSTLAIPSFSGELSPAVDGGVVWDRHSVDVFEEMLSKGEVSAGFALVVQSFLEVGGNESFKENSFGEPTVSLAEYLRMAIAEEFDQFKSVSGTSVKASSLASTVVRVLEDSDESVPTKKQVLAKLENDDFIGDISRRLGTNIDKYKLLTPFGLSAVRKLVGESLSEDSELKNSVAEAVVASINKKKSKEARIEKGKDKKASIKKAKTKGRKIVSGRQRLFERPEGFETFLPPGAPMEFYLVHSLFCESLELDYMVRKGLLSSSNEKVGTITSFGDISNLLEESLGSSIDKIDNPNKKKIFKKKLNNVRFFGEALLGLYVDLLAVGDFSFTDLEDTKVDSSELSNDFADNIADQIYRVADIYFSYIDFLLKDEACKPLMNGNFQFDNESVVFVHEGDGKSDKNTFEYQDILKSLSVLKSCCSLAENVFEALKISPGEEFELLNGLVEGTEDLLNKEFSNLKVVHDPSHSITNINNLNRVFDRFVDVLKSFPNLVISELKNFSLTTKSPSAQD